MMKKRSGSSSHKCITPKEVIDAFQENGSTKFLFTQLSGCEKCGRVFRKAWFLNGDKKKR